MERTSQKATLIGLTGAIGAGKSKVRDFFFELGAFVQDADSIARRVLHHPSNRSLLIKEFGEKILNQDREISRPLLASLVFKDESERKKLNGIIHPLVQREFAEWVQSLPVNSLAVYDVPLLFESELEGQFDAVVVVHAPLLLRMERVKKRNGWSEEEFMDREKSQMSSDDKLRRADYVIENNHDESVLLENVQSVIRKIKNQFGNINLRER